MIFMSNNFFATLKMCNKIISNFTIFHLNNSACAPVSRIAAQQVGGDSVGGVKLFIT